MAHKALINGTAYGISGGKTLVGGTAYKINKGKTLVSGTAYSISFLTGNEAGLYKNGSLVYLWDELVSNGAVTLDGTTITDYSTSSTYGGDLRIPEGITIIYQSAFQSCSSLTSIVVPNSVIAIGNYAFRYCTQLTSVTIGTGVQQIGKGVVTSCSALTSFTFKNTSGWWMSTSSSATSGTALDVSNPSTNAQVLVAQSSWYLKRS